MPRVPGTGGSQRSALGRWIADHEDRLLPLLSYVVVGVIWEVASDTHLVNPVFFASPVLVVESGIRSVQSAQFWSDVWTSVYEFLVGYALAVTLGFAFGVLLGWFRRVAYFFEPLVDGLNATPTLALMPLVLIWFGLGPSARLAIVFLTTFVPVVLNVYTGVRTVNQGMLKVAASFGATRARLVRNVVIPSIAPFGFAGARIGVGRAVSGVVVAEFFAAQSGLAYRIFQGASLLATADVLFNSLALTFLALGAFKLVGLVEHRALAWQTLGSRSATTGAATYG